MKRIAAVVMIAWAAVAWTPGGDYPGTGTSTNAVYDPYLGSILPWSQNVQVVGRIATNDVAVFTDRSGRYLKGTNLSALVVTSAALTNEAALRASGDAAGSNYVALATAGLAPHTSNAAIHLTAAQSARIAAALTNESDAAALAAIAQYAATGTVRRLHVDANTWYEMLPGTATLYTVQTVTGTNVTFSADFEDSNTHATLYPSTLAFPFSVDGWSCNYGEYSGEQGYLLNSPGDGAVWFALSGIPSTFYYVYGGSGEAYIQYSEWKITNSVRYDLSATSNHVLIAEHTTNTVIHVTGAERTAWNTGTNTAAEALLTADTAAGTINNHVFSANPHAGYVVTPQGLTNVLTAAPSWIGRTNLTGIVTLTNSYERPQYLYATGAVTVAFAGLRAPQPVYLVVRGASSLAFAGAYVVGGGNWQTNMSNHFVVWAWGTNTLVNPVTATED
jgi:hypothetical protein